MKSQVKISQSGKDINKKVILKYLPSVLVIVLICLFLLALIPMDIFKHGFYSTEPEIDENVEVVSYDLIKKGTIEQKFIPVKNHIAGVEINICGYNSEMDGVIRAEVKEKSGKVVCSEDIDVAEIGSDGWRQIYFDRALKKNHEYLLVLRGDKSTSDFPNISLVKADSDKNPEENSGYCYEKDAEKYVMLLAFAYSMRTFTFCEKILISFYCFSLICVVLYYSFKNKKFLLMALYMVLFTILVWNYTHNTMDSMNASFLDFQSDSQALVSSSVYAKINNVKMNQYGLGIYTDIRGTFKSNAFLDTPDAMFLSDESYDRGYAKDIAVIAVPRNEYTADVIVAGNSILFENQDKYVISSVEEDSDFYYANLNTTHVLSYACNGSLANVRILEENGDYLPVGKWGAYSSHIGLQGKVMRRLAGLLKKENIIKYFEFLCSMATAFVFIVIVFLLSQKYDKLYAAIFYITVWLSPWVVNFARNLYWVEFTWFLPMSTGLFLSLKVENRRMRFLCYILGGVTIFLKSLCGYEYITTVMMGLIIFLLVDIGNAIVKKDRQRFLLLLRTTFIVGCCALAGFALAIVIHGKLRGDGDLLTGIESIWRRDVLRRTFGGHLEDFQPVHWEALNASQWETISVYFKFSTEIITGLSGNLFPILSIIPLVIIGYNFHWHKKADFNMLFMYFATLVMTISWFYFGKSHSYIHRTMNYVLWYFGYVQTCLYIVVKQVVSWVNGYSGNI